MNLYLPLTLLGAATIANAELDLYVREQFVDSNGDRCGSCDVGNGCFLDRKAFFLQQSCFNRGYVESSVYDEVQDGVICRQDFSTSCGAPDIEFNAETVEDCEDSWTIGECVKSKRMTKLKSWCKEIDEPEGEYTVPLVAFQDFAKFEDCGSANYLNLLLPDEGGACAPLSFRGKDGMYLTGSRQVSCNGNVYEAVRYESTDCTGDALKSSVDGSSDQCPASADGQYTLTNDCGAPSIYCKASKEFSGRDPSESSYGTIESETNEGSGGDAGTATAENEGASNAPGGLLILTTVALSFLA